jgi:hypothetical protein
MDFAEKLFLAAYNPLSSRSADFEELVTYVAIDSLSPLTPQRPTDESLGHLIANNFFARVTEGGELRHADTGTFSAGNGTPKSVGVIDISGITTGSLTAVAIDVRDGNIVALLVDVRTVPGGYAASPLSRPAPQDPSPLDLPIVFTAPHGSVVKFNGSVVDPVFVDSIGRHDVYELHGVYRGKFEDISVFCGDAIGTIEGTVVANTSVYGGVARGANGYESATNSIRYDIAALAVTREEFRPLRDSITVLTQSIATRIGELLDTNDMDGFVEMARGYGELLGRNGNISSEYRGFFTSWQRSGSVHGAKREITIDAIEIRGIDSVRVRFTTLLTLESGNKFTAESTIILDHVDGDWLIFDMTNELFKSDSRTWSAAA